MSPLLISSNIYVTPPVSLCVAPISYLNTESVRPPSLQILVQDDYDEDDVDEDLEG